MYFEWGNAINNHVIEGLSRDSSKAAWQKLKDLKSILNRFSFIN